MAKIIKLQLISLACLLLSSPSYAELTRLTPGVAVSGAERIQVTWKGQVNPSVGIRPDQFEGRAQGTTVSIGCPSRCAVHVPNLARILREARPTTSLCGEFVFAKITLFRNGVDIVGVVSEDGRCLSMEGQNYLISAEFADIIKNRPTRNW